MPTFGKIANLIRVQGGDWVCVGAMGCESGRGWSQWGAGWEGSRVLPVSVEEGDCAVDAEYAGRMRMGPSPTFDRLSGSVP